MNNKYDPIPLSFRVSRKLNHENMSSHHYHNKYEIYYLIKGERFYFLKDRTYHLKEGDLILINKNELHKTTSGDLFNHERILIQFNEEFIKDGNKNLEEFDLLSCFKKNISFFTLEKQEQQIVENILFNMINEKKERHVGYTSYHKTLLIQLLININRFSENNNYDKNDIEHPDFTHAKVSKIAQYINNNYMNDLSLKLLSKVFYLNPNYISTIFKEATGFTYTEYLNSVRIKEAEKLLRETKNNITKISEKVGYNNLTHFDRNFKKITSLTPMEYRKVYSICE